MESSQAGRCSLGESLGEAKHEHWIWKQAGQINEKALAFYLNTRAFISEVDGARTRNLRIDSPVL